MRDMYLREGGQDMTVTVRGVGNDSVVRLTVVRDSYPPALQAVTLRLTITVVLDTTSPKIVVQAPATDVLVGAPRGGLRSVSFAGSASEPLSAIRIVDWRPVSRPACP